MDPSQAATAIREDRIDVLVDLTMHMERNYLETFARKPAPVQACWLAYPGTTGLSAMDYRITDRYLDPPDGDVAVYSEQTIRLPDTFWCYHPLTAEEAPSHLPPRAAGHIRFGCLNNFCKVNEDVIALWSQVLRNVDASRLVLLAPPGDAAKRTLAAFRGHGVDPARIEFVEFMPRLDYLGTYRSIDVCLDTFPYNGHTTSLDALWMGVPVVTMVGDRVVGRAGLCQAMNLGLPELVADTPEQFVKIAVDLACDFDRLAELHASLRARMESSPLMDAPRFARNLEAAYRTMWRQWCEKISTRSPA
jgi:predicted O-linked N-acetylglucosamine transferase (SPINDLY family)